MKTKKNPGEGFTLIEVLIVITVIGVLATLMLIAYQHSLKKTRDAKRKSDLHTFQLALETYHAKNGTYQVSEAGYAGNGQGWVTYSGGSYPSSISGVLISEGYLSQADYRDPTQGDTGYMLYICDSGQTYSLSATLELPTDSDKTYTQSVCQGSTIYNTYGKNYAVGNK